MICLMIYVQPLLSSFRKKLKAYLFAKADPPYFLSMAQNNIVSLVNIEIDNNEQGVIGNFTTINNIRITKVEPE